MKTYIRIIKFLKPFKLHIVGALVSSLLFVLFNLASLWITASLIQTIFSTSTETITQEITQNFSLNDKLKNLTVSLFVSGDRIIDLRNFCIVILVTFLAKNLFLYIKSLLVVFLQLKTITNVRILLYRHIRKMPLSFFDRRRKGELSSLLLNDVNALNTSLVAGFDRLFLDPLNIVALFFTLMVISPKLTVFSLFLLPISGYMIVKISNSLRRKSKRMLTQIAIVVNRIYDTIDGIRVIKAFGSGKKEDWRFTKEVNHHFQLSLRQKRLNALSSPLSETIGTLIGVGILYYAGIAVLSTDFLSAEDFIRFIIILFSMLTPIKNIGKMHHQIQIGIAAGVRIFDLLDEVVPDEVGGTKSLKSFHNNIRFEKVSFQYPSRPRMPVLKEISFELEKGQSLAIVGPSGAGKSTIVDLLPRFYTSSNGRITIDDVNIREIDLNDLRDNIGIVSQENFLFYDTIANNISYGIGNAKKQAIEDAARVANAVEVISEQPEGFDTVVGERGVQLSGGQRQRIAIARAILKNPPILILDEATSALDTENEKQVQSALDNLMKDRTVLVIAHRLSTIQNADKIIVLNRGRLVETGTHEELLENKGLYFYLYNLQFQKAN